MYNQKTGFCNVLKSGMTIACVIMHKNECRVQDTSSYISTTLEGKESKKVEEIDERLVFHTEYHC